MKTPQSQNPKSAICHLPSAIGFRLLAIPRRPPLVSTLLTLLTLSTLPTAPAATVTGSLTEINLQPLNTRLLLTPTNDVLLTATGLSAGPPKIIETSNGQFTTVLDAGDYTVSLPLIPTRNPFIISVPPTSGTLNITNLLPAPKTYTYTNNLNYTVKATAADQAPDTLDAKISVAGTLTKQTVTNGAAVTITLSNAPPPGSPWLTNGTALYYTLGRVGIGATTPGALLHLKDNNATQAATQLLLESTDEGAVGFELKSIWSANNWQLKILADTFVIGKPGVGDFLTINSSGLVTAPTGFAVGASPGISTNIAVLLPGPKTNTLVFTKGLLTAIQ